MTRKIFLWSNLRQSWLSFHFCIEIDSSNFPHVKKNLFSSIPRPARVEKNFYVIFHLRDLCTDYKKSCAKTRKVLLSYYFFLLYFQRFSISHLASLALKGHGDDAYAPSKNFFAHTHMIIASNSHRRTGFRANILPKVDMHRYYTGVQKKRGGCKETRTKASCKLCFADAESYDIRPLLCAWCIMVGAV